VANHDFQRTSGDASICNRHHPNDTASAHRVRLVSDCRKIDTMASAVQEDEAHMLEDALLTVRQQTMLMRKCLETPGKLMDALKCRYEDILIFQIKQKLLGSFICC
jgi:hypothetical protein